MAGPAGFLSGCRSPVRSMSVGLWTPSPVASAGAVITAPVRALFSFIAVLASAAAAPAVPSNPRVRADCFPVLLTHPIFSTPLNIAWNNLTSWSDYSERNGNKMELSDLRRRGTSVGIFSGLNKLLAMWSILTLAMVQ